MRNKRSMRVTFTEVANEKQLVRVDMIFKGDRPEKMEFYGVWHDLEGRARYPFVLLTDGTIDYGEGYGDDDQHYGSNFLSADKKYERGELFTCVHGGEEVVLRLKDLRDLT